MTSKLSNLFKSRSAHSMFRLGITTILVLIAIIAASAAYHPIQNYDIWRNLTVGRWITEELSIPRVEFLSYTESGRPWTDYEWLSETIFWTVYSLGNVPALILYKTILIFLTFVFLYRHSSSRGVNPLWSVPIVFVPVAAIMQFRLLIRPHLHSFLLGAALIWVLGRGKRIWRLVWIFVIFVVWSNLHGGHLGLLIVALSLADRALRRQVVPTILVALLGLMVNPYTWNVISPLFEIVHVQHPTRLLVAEWSALRPSDMPWLWAYIGLSFCLLPVPGRRMRVFDAAVLVVFTGLSMRSVRMVSFLLLLSSPGNIESLHLLITRRRFRFLQIPAALIAVAATFVYLGSNMPLESGVRWGMFPRAAARYVIDNTLNVRAFNDMHQGSYLAWKWYPDNTIYMDGRTEIFSDLARTERAACENAESWRYFIDGYDMNAAVLDYPKLWRGTPTATMYPLFRFFGWRTVAWDDGGVLMLSPDHEFDNLISSDGFVVLDPFILDPKPWAFTTMERESFLDELDRARERQPESIRALYIGGNYHTNANRPATALEYYRAIARLAPDDPDINARTAMAWERLGAYENALDSWFDQRRHGSEEGLVEYHIGRLHLLLGRAEKARSFLRKAVKHPDSPPQWRELLQRSSLSDQENGVRREISSVLNRAEQIAENGVRSMRSNQTDIADSLLRVAVAMAPMKPDIHQNIGVVLARKGLWNQAEAEFREAIEQDASSLWARYNLAGLLIETRHDTTEAVLQLRAVLDDSPDTTLRKLATTYMNSLHSAE